MPGRVDAPIAGTVKPRFELQFPPRPDRVDTPLPIKSQTDAQSFEDLHWIKISLATKLTERDNDRDHRYGTSNHPITYTSDSSLACEFRSSSLPWHHSPASIRPPATIFYHRKRTAFAVRKVQVLGHWTPCIGQTKQKTIVQNPHGVPRQQTFFAANGGQTHLTNA